MPAYNQLLFTLGVAVVAAPTAMLLIVGLAALFQRDLAETTVARVVHATLLIGLAAAAAILVIMLWTGIRSVPVAMGHWVVLPEYHFEFKLIFDRLSVPMVILTFVLCGTIGAFASRYMHREAGFNRFFGLLALFVVGMLLTTLAGTIELLFAGWEFVGLSSALLVAFFQERQMPVRNGLHVWTIYRVSDAALLAAVVILHHLRGEGDFSVLLGTGSWPDGVASLTASQALMVGALILVAAAGKSGLIPFSGWLPRAMEGPTPSSAVFYGALSVHLGAFLLLRVSPILELSWWLCAATVALGLATAVYATVTSHVQTDIKSALAFASLAQVGLIVAEIGLGFRYLALVHILGHACLRMLQFLRAPTLLHDYHLLENAIGSHLPRAAFSWEEYLPQRVRLKLYRFALSRGHLDSVLRDYVAAPLCGCFKACERWERRWTALLANEPPKLDSHLQGTELLEDVA